MLSGKTVTSDKVISHKYIVKAHIFKDNEYYKLSLWNVGERNVIRTINNVIKTNRKMKR